MLQAHLSSGSARSRFSGSNNCRVSRQLVSAADCLWQRRNLLNGSTNVPQIGTTSGSHNSSSSHNRLQAIRKYLQIAKQLKVFRIIFINY